MRIKVDKQSDTLYFRFDETQVSDSEEIKPGLILDYNKEGKVIGLEVLNISTRISAEDLKKMQYEVA